MNQIRDLIEHFGYRYTYDWTWDHEHIPGTGSNEHRVTEIEFPVIQYRRRTGVSLPNFKKIIQSGGNATTPFSGWTVVFDPSSGSASLHDRYDDPAGNVGYTVDWHSEGTAPFVFSDYGTSIDFVSSIAEVTADNLALKALLRKIREERTRFQGQIFLGEFAESIRMIASPAKSLRKGVLDYLSAVEKRTKGLKKLSTGQARRARNPPAMSYSTVRDQKAAAKNNRRAVLARESLVGKAVADTWLEYSFGWAPLINDIRDAQKAFKDLCERKFASRISGFGKDEATKIYASNEVWGNIRFDCLRTIVESISIKYTAGMRFRTFANPGSSRLCEQFGMVSEQFIPTAWELLPWSFLVDYFTNIGDILDANATNTSDVTWVSKSIRKVQSQKWSGYPNLARNVSSWRLTPNASVSGSIGTPLQTAKSVVRSNPGSVPSPHFEVSMPTNPIQWINMGALSQNMSRLRHFFF